MTQGGLTATATLGALALGTVHEFEDYRISGGAGNDLLYLGAGNDSILAGSGDDTVYGGAGNDTVGTYYDFHDLTGRDQVYGGAGNDEIFVGQPGGTVYGHGSTGNDVLQGGRGADTMAGGTGDDVFVFGLGDSGTATGEIDTINFFVTHSVNLAHHNRIDLSGMDANLDMIGKDHFTYIGTAAFSAEGQVRVVQIGTSTFSELNYNTTPDADMRICLGGQAVSGISVQDFIL